MRKRGIQKAPGANLTLKFVSKPMSQTQMAKVLSGGDGKPVKPAVIRAHVASGAPADKRGRVRLIDYAAWLVAEISNPNQAP